MAQKISVINPRPMETPGIEGVSVAKVLKWHEKGINRNGDRPRLGFRQNRELATV